MKRTTTLGTSRGSVEQSRGERRPLQQTKERAQELIGDHPGTSILTCFLVGFGAGLLLTACVGSSGRQRENVVSRLGHRMRDAVSGVFPHAMTGR